MNCKQCPFDPNKMVKPFSNATEAETWQDNNCFTCINYDVESQDIEQTKCRLAYNIDFGYIIGEIPLETAKEIGCEYNPLYGSVSLRSRCRMYRSELEKDLPF